MKIILYICIRKNKETYLIKNLKNMDIILKTQTKEIEKGTLVIIKRFSYFSMSYLESKI